MADKIARWLQCQDSGWQCCSFCGVAVRKSAVKWVKASEDKNLNYCPHCGARMGYLPDIRKEPRWISVKDGTPDEHDSIFAKLPHLSKHMWAKESDDVIVYVRFPDGSGRSTEGRLRDGKWHTKISPSLEPVVTHWMPMPEPPQEDE